MVLDGPLTKLVLWDFEETLAERPGRWGGPTPRLEAARRVVASAG